MTVKTHNNTRVVRAFEVRTGKLVWQFSDSKPGTGGGTWEAESWANSATPASGRR